ncbi:MAG: response regulator [Salibacteraceae bacterium]
MADQSKIPTVLLIDDYPIDNIINERMMLGCGFCERVHINSSSRSALEFLSNLARNINTIPKVMIPNVIFLDINMPMMDGFQFLEEYRKFDEAFRAHTKIYMLSTSSNPVDLMRSEEDESIRAFFSKPLTEEDLEVVTVQFAQGEEMAA